MNERFTLAPIRGDRILQAYPLIRELATEISLVDWRAYVKSNLAAKVKGGEACDIIGICSSNGYLRGQFTYRVVPDLRYGQTLDVEYFIVESVFSPREIAAALMAGVEEIASTENCNAIHAHLPSAANWLVKMLHDRGYSAGAWQLCKPVDGDHGPSRRSV